ncbi:hypothetical protein F4815DRAFT_470533 [Daldinia loculata]|nr:hypothetical protein F4815DRAFT_470533 [Daldinia loculata]
MARCGLGRLVLCFSLVYFCNGAPINTRSATLSAVWKYYVNAMKKSTGMSSYIRDLGIIFLVGKPCVRRPRRLMYFASYPSTLAVDRPVKMLPVTSIVMAWKFKLNYLPE